MPVDKTIKYYNNTPFQLEIQQSNIENAGLDVECLLSGPQGGDAQIAAKLVVGEIDAVLFFIDPLFSHPHEVDVQMLMRLCNVHDIPLATNYQTAKCIIESIQNIK